MRARQLIAACLAASVTIGCSATVRARDALDGEPLAWERIHGVEVVAEATIDGSSGGLMGKPSYPTVTRHLVPTDGSTTGELLDRIVDASVEQGWEGQGDAARLPYRATKSLRSGRGRLLVSIHSHEPPARVVLTMSVH